MSGFATEYSLFTIRQVRRLSEAEETKLEKQKA